jgi:hypothetical protein
MSTDTSTTTDTDATAKDAADDGTDWKAEARKWELRAKENKTAAEELTTLKASQLTDQQKVEERISQMEKRTAEAESRALRADIASKHGISAEDRDLFLTGTDEESLTAQAKRLAEREVERKKTGNVAPKEGEAKTTGKTDAEPREFVKQLFGNAD